MNVADVVSLLEENLNPRGIANWEKMHHPGTQLKSFGLGLTQLRKLAKKVGRDHDLAQELWASDIYDAKVIGLLIDEPKKVTREQAETQVEQLNHGMLSHVFSSCDATLAKTKFAVDLCSEWVKSDDPTRRQCGNGLLYEISKYKGKKAPDDGYFLAHIDHIQKTWRAQPQPVLMAMGGALMGVGKRNKVLNAAALKVVREIGPVPNPGCEPFGVEKHLTSDYLKKKLGL